MLGNFQDGQTPGDFVDHELTFTATWFNSLTGALYYTTGNEGDIVRWDDPTQPNADFAWKSKVFISQVPLNMGAARVVGDYTGVAISPIWDDYDVEWEDADVDWFVTEPVTFKLYANKSLVFTTTRGNSDVFRLPTGYKTDTYEVEVDGTVRVRAIHLGETPSSLMRS
jgi:hypothetical protein